MYLFQRIILFSLSLGTTIQSTNLNFFDFELLTQIPWDPNVIENKRCKDDVNFWIKSLQAYANATVRLCGEDDACKNERQQSLDQNQFAIKQIDAFGKIPPNLLNFNVRWQGSWDECMDVKSEPDYDSQFCWVAVAPNFELSNADIDTALIGTGCGSVAQIQWSVCMPRSCTNKDLTALFATLNNATESMAEFCSATCISPSTPEKKTSFWIVTAYCLMIGFLVVVSSIVDYVTEPTEKQNNEGIRSKTGIKILLQFSAYTNGAEILSTQKRSGQIHSLNCIRVFSTTWVIIGHAFLIYTGGDNPLQVVDSRNYFLNEAMLNAFPSVDSFLFIGSVLLGFLFFKEMKRNRRTLKSPMYWSLYYIHRYIRLSIPYFLFLGFYVVMFPYVTRSPLAIASDLEACKKYWWRNILYISSFFDTSEMCMIHTWYLSTDMWIHYFSPLLLVPLFLSPLLGGIMALSLVVLTIGATYGTYFKHDFPASLTVLSFQVLSNPNAVNDFMKYIYMAPWIRYIPNLLGILTGYLLHKIDNRKKKLNWVVVVLLWLASAAVGIACIYGLYDYNRGKTDLNDFEKASYYVFHRVGWSLSLVWVVVACQHNMAGFIKNFMEHGFWMPLGRLGYCAYLIHFMVIYVVFAGEREPLHFTNTTYAYIHAGLPMFLISYGFAFVWSCCIEIPFAKLEKMATEALFKRYRNPISDKPKDAVVSPQKSNNCDDWQIEEAVQRNNFLGLRYYREADLSQNPPPYQIHM